MARTVDVGINIRAIDSTRRAVQSVRRGFRQIQSDFSSIRAPRISGNMSSGIRKIRGEVMRAAGITRGWMGTMINGSNVMARRTLPRMQGAIRKTATETQAASRKMSKGFGDVNQVLSSSLLTMGLFSVSVTSLGKKLVKSTIELDQYIRGFKVLDGGMKEAKTTMQEIIEVSKLPGIQIPAASRGYMNLRAVGISGRFAITILEEFSNAVAIAGGKSNDLRESIRQLSQTLSIDKIDMENWRVILERLPTMRTAIQKSFGPKAIHTEELNKILDKEGLSAEQAWRKILEQMTFTERADPNTITNAVERLNNTLWHMAANFGSVYAPAVETLLRKLNGLAEGFNEMNKPMREFLAFGITSIGMTIAFGAGIYGLVKIFGALKSIVGSTRQSMRDFYDKPRYGDSERLTPMTGRERKGRIDTGRVRSDVSLRTMISDHRRSKPYQTFFDPNRVTHGKQLKDLADTSQQEASEAKMYYDRALNNYKKMDEHQERLIRESTYNQLNKDLYDSRVERDMLNATRRYESELADISGKIEAEHNKINAHKEGVSQSEQELLNKRERYARRRAELADKLQVSRTVKTPEMMMARAADFEEFTKTGAHMDQIDRQLKSPISSVGHLRTLYRGVEDAEIGLSKSYEEERFNRMENELGKERNSLRKGLIDDEMKDWDETYRQRNTELKDTMELGMREVSDTEKKGMQKDLENRTKNYGDYREQQRQQLTRLFAGTMPKEAIDAEMNSEMKKWDNTYKRRNAELQKIMSSGSQELTDIERRNIEQELRNRKDTYDQNRKGFRKELLNFYSDASNVEVPEESTRRISEGVTRDLDRQFAQARNDVETLRTEYVDALQKGDKATLASLELQRQQMVDNFDNMVRDVETHARETQKALADEQMGRETYVDDRGMTRFADTDTEAGVRGTVTEARKQSKRDLDRMRETTQRTDTLRAKALANLKAIDHFGVWAEVAYGGVIALVLGGAALAIGSLIAHFQELQDTIQRFEKYMNKNLTVVIKWESQYKEWRTSIRNVKNEYEILTEAIKRAFESELKGLGYLELSDAGLTKDQTERKKYLEKVIESKRMPLDEYSLEYYESLARKHSTELLKPDRVQGAYKKFGEELKKVIDARKNMPLVNALQKTLSDKQLQNVIFMRRWHQYQEDDVLKLRNTEGLGFMQKQSKNIALGIANQFNKFSNTEEIIKKVNQIVRDRILKENQRTPEAIELLGGGTSNIIKALDNLILEADLQERQRRFTTLLNNIQSMRDEGISKVLKLGFKFSDIEEWKLGISGARGELEKLRSSILSLSIPMQDFQKNGMRYLESIISKEDNAIKQIEKLNEQRLKAQDKYDLNTFLYTHRDAIQAISRVSPKENVLKILGRKLGDEVIPPAQLDEINRILKVLGGDKEIETLTKSITQATVRGNETDLEAATQKYTDFIDKFKVDIKKHRDDRLMTLRRESQDSTYERIKTGVREESRVQALRLYIQTLKALETAETDYVQKDVYQRHLKVANSQLLELLETMEVRNERFRQTRFLDPTGNVLGVSPEQLARLMSHLSEVTNDYELDFHRILKLWSQADITNSMMDPKNIKISGQGLIDVHKIMEKLVNATLRWERHIGNIGQRIDSLRSDLISAPKYMRGIIEGEMRFLEGLSAPDREVFDAKLLEYKKTYAEIQKLERLLSGNSDYEASIKIAEHLLGLNAMKDMPAAQAAIEDMVSSLKEGFKDLSDGTKLEELNRKLKGFREELDGMLDEPNREKILGYLTGIRLRLNDINVAVPASHALKNLREELERVGRITEGTAESRLRRKIALEDQIRGAEERVKVEQELRDTLRDYLPLAGKNADSLNVTAEAQERMNQAQKRSIDNYDALYEAKRRDAVASVLATELSKKQEVTESSKAIDRIRKIGIKQINMRHISPQEREQMLLSGTLGSREFSGKVVSSQYKSFMRSTRRGLNELDMLDTYYRQYYSKDAEGQESFRKRVAEQVRSTTGEEIDPQELSNLIEALDGIRRDEGNAIINAIANRREAIGSARSDASNIGKMFVRDLYEGISKESSRLYDKGFEALWGALVDNPRQASRREEDRMRQKKKQIDDIRELRSEREISARETRERIRDIEKDYTKETLRFEQDALIERKRMYEDYVSTVIKGIAKIAAETLKARAGVTLGNWAADALGLDEATISQQQPVEPQGGFWQSTGDTLKIAVISTLAKKYGVPLLEKVLPDLPGAGAGAGLQQETIINQFVDPGTSGAAAGGWKAGLSSLGSALPHMLAMRMAIGTLIDGFNPKRNVKSDDYYQKNPFNRFIQDIFGVSFDNDDNDALPYMSGYGQAATYAKRLGEHTPQDILDNYEAGVAEGMSKINTGGVANSKDGGSDSVIEAIEHQTSEIVKTILENGGQVLVVDENLGRMVSHIQDGMHRQHKLRKGA